VRPFQRKPGRTRVTREAIKPPARRERRSNLRGSCLILAAVSSCVISAPVSAHIGTGLRGGLESGLEHPFTGLDHLSAMVSVGLWGAFLGRPLIYALPVIFPLMMVVGAVFGMLGTPFPSVERGVALSVVILGLCMALAIKSPAWAACGIVGVFALLHGYSHGAELPSAADPVGYSTGFVVATGSLHLLGIGLGLLNKLACGVYLTRGLGAAVLLAGCWFLHSALAQ
jgi:urease accessory protein